MFIIFKIIQIKVIPFLVFFVDFVAKKSGVLLEEYSEP